MEETPKYIMSRVPIMLANIVDDDQDMTEILVEKLENRGVHPETYKVHNDPKEFLSFLTNDIGVAAIDHNLPGINGLELMKQFKAKNKENYGIVVTGITDYRILGKYIKAGASDYVEKDNSGAYLDELADAIVKGFVIACDRKKAEDERSQFYEIMNARAKQTEEMISKLTGK